MELITKEECIIEVSNRGRLLPQKLWFKLQLEEIKRREEAFQIETFLNGNPDQSLPNIHSADLLDPFSKVGSDSLKPGTDCPPYVGMKSASNSTVLSSSLVNDLLSLSLAGCLNNGCNIENANTPITSLYVMKRQEVFPLADSRVIEETLKISLKRKYSAI